MPRIMLNGLRRALNWIAERQQRRILRELRRLDDRTLIDIGVDPQEIAAIARCSRVGRRSRGRCRALIAKSSLGIMAAAPRILASRPVQCPVPVVLALLCALLPLGVVAAASAQNYSDKPILPIPFAAGGPPSSHIPR